MGKIGLSLNEEHYNAVSAYVRKLMFNSAVHETMYKEYLDSNPLTLTFDLPESELCSPPIRTYTEEEVKEAVIKGLSKKMIPGLAGHTNNIMEELNNLTTK